LNIIIDNSGYGLDNIGDLAMLQVAVERLSELWPEATIYVICADSNKLNKFVPRAKCLDLTIKNAWLSDFSLIGGFRHFFPKMLQTKLRMCESYFRIKFPKITLKIMSWRFGQESLIYRHGNKFLNLIAESDIVIATGGGYVNDTFSEHASKLFDVLLLAQRYQKPTAMLGQGLGPLSDRNLVKKFKRVLVKLNHITLREGLLSPEILKELVISREKPSIIVTGDDAIEKSYSSRMENLGNKIGLNIRNASYATLPSGILEQIGMIIEDYLLKKKTSYQFLPISLVPGEESDINALSKLMNMNVHDLYEIESSLSVTTIIQRVSQCRVVITGSYHAALFALSQGVQVIGVTASKYYDSKFMGLLQQFEVGIQILYLKDGVDKLSDFLDIAWSRADDQRPILIKNAKKQIYNGKDAYRQLKKLVKNNA
jgi:colanic acid/amylovoran biosynthesis protein